MRIPIPDQVKADCKTILVALLRALGQYGALTAVDVLYLWPYFDSKSARGCVPQIPGYVRITWTGGLSRRGRRTKQIEDGIFSDNNATCITASSTVNPAARWGIEREVVGRLVLLLPMHIDHVIDGKLDIVGRAHPLYPCDVLLLSVRVA